MHNSQKELTIQMSINRGLDKMLLVYTMRYYLAIKENEILKKKKEKKTIILRDFLGGPVVKSQCMMPGFHAWLGN